MKKLKKLVLKKETVSVLNDFSLSRIKGGDTWGYLYWYATLLNSHMYPGECMKGHLASDNSYCYCTNGDNTCNTCNTCNQNTCQASYEGTCGTSCCL
jgi:natural product precursor